MERAALAAVRSIMPDSALTDDMARAVVIQAALYEPTEKDIDVAAKRFGLNAADLKARSDWIREHYAASRAKRLGLVSSAQEQEHSPTAQAKDRAQNKAQHKAQRAARRKH